MKKQTTNILIVDDNMLDRALIKEMLKEYSAEYSAVETESGTEGLSLLNHKDIDCILVDFSMPDMNGIEFTKSVYENRNNNTIPVVIITGKGSEKIAVDAMKSGASDYLIKGSIETNILGKTIDNAIIKKNMEVQILESENRYKRLVELSPDLMALHNDKQIVFINSAGAHLLGMTTAEALKGISLLNYIHKDFLKKTRMLFKKILDLDEISRIEHISIKHNDHYLDMEMVLAPVFYLGKPVIQIVGRDITRLVTTQNELKELSYNDELTRIPNRRKFSIQLDHQWRVAIRNNQPVSIIMADIDYFKLYNDLYGHQAGDNCLKQVARALQESIRRPTDMVARYGGEEFIIILPNTEKKGAVSIIQDIQKKIKLLNISHEGSKIDPLITLSLGVATLVPKKDSNSDLLINYADQALYMAKNNGRNQFIAMEKNL